MASRRRKRERRRAIKAQRVAAVYHATGMAVAKRQQARRSPDAQKPREIDPARRAAIAATIVDYRPKAAAKPAFKRAARVQPLAPRKHQGDSPSATSISRPIKSGLIRRAVMRVETKVLAPVKLAKRELPAPRTAMQKAVALTAQKKFLHDDKSRHSDTRGKDVPTCKPRPKSSRPKPGGGSRPFIPWCK